MSEVASSSSASQKKEPTISCLPYIAVSKDEDLVALSIGEQIYVVDKR